MVAKTTEPPLPDADARHAIAHDLGTTMLVEAAAGTGKTSSLVERMVSLVATGAARIENLSAVTFTIRAAAQLSQRFQNELEKRREAETQPGRRRVLDEALRSLESSFIGTIHAFCARLLRERPVEAGVDPGFREMDEPENNVARREAWDRHVQFLFASDDPIVARLARLRVRFDDLREAYDEVCENSDVVVAVGPEVSEPDFAEARRRVETFLAAAAETLPPEPGPDGWTGFENAVRRARRLMGLLETNHAADFVQVLQALRGSRPREKAPKGMKSALESLQVDVVKPALRAWAEYVHPIVMPVLVGARDAYRAWRRENGRMNFQDLLVEARNLLRGRPDVRRALRKRFTPILVDEFQDTDPIQAEILFYLTGETAEERDWKKLRPVPGSLFVVGDPKQSIYRFRRADIETYQTVRRLLEESGGRIVTLTTNFRSTPALCGWVNRAFGDSGLLPATATARQAAYVPLAARRGGAVGAPSVLRLGIAASGRGAEPVVREDAARIASFVAASIAGRLHAPGDFLILFRRRRFMGAYARALEERGVPYEIAGGGAFGESSELDALMPLLDALADPDDPVPFVAALRGPIFGVDDDALYRFAGAGGRFRFTAAPPEGADPRIARAAAILREVAADVEALPPAAAIARLCGRLGLTALAAARELGDSRAGNLVKALAAARKFSSEGRDFPAVVRELARMRDEDLIEQMSLEPGRPGVVRLMTLHGAKGLEARVVFLAEPAAENFPARDYWIDRRADPPAGHFRIVQKLGQRGEQDLAVPPGWEAMCEEEQEFERAENVRLLYVGATRARDLLVVSIRRTATGKVSGPWALLDRFLPADLPLVAAPAAPEAPAAALTVLPGEARADRDRRRTAAALPTYAIATVTQVAHEAAEKPEWEWTGRGLSWGRVLHGVLEGLMRDPALNVRACAANLLVAEERPLEEADEVVRVVEGVRSSDLWRRALAARRRLVEVPFALPVPRAELGRSDGPDTVLLQGAIDLAFEEDDGWVLVDYKSDTLPPEGDVTPLVAFYEPQIRLYRSAWEALTRRPARAGLFFIQDRRTVWLDRQGAPRR